MPTLTLPELKDRLEEIAERVEAGETVVVTRHGQPVLQLVPHRTRGGIDFAALERFKAEHGIDRIVTYIAEDFDDPLPEDFLLRPLPPAP